MNKDAKATANTKSSANGHQKLIEGIYQFSIFLWILEFLGWNRRAILSDLSTLLRRAVNLVLIPAATEPNGASFCELFGLARAARSAATERPYPRDACALIPTSIKQLSRAHKILNNSIEGLLSGHRQVRDSFALSGSFVGIHLSDSMAQLTVLAVQFT